MSANNTLANETLAFVELVSATHEKIAQERQIVNAAKVRAEPEAKVAADLLISHNYVSPDDHVKLAATLEDHAATLVLLQNLIRQSSQVPTTKEANAKLGSGAVSELQANAVSMDPATEAIFRAAGRRL